eukprot:8095368-Pyramimonas_sp.AAC.1
MLDSSGGRLKAPRSRQGGPGRLGVTWKRLWSGSRSSPEARSGFRSPKTSSGPRAILGVEEDENEEEEEEQEEEEEEEEEEQEDESNYPSATLPRSWNI